MSQPSPIAAPAVAAAVIQARDLSNAITTDVLYDRWTAGKLRHLVAALDGAPVAVVTDNRTGHAPINVRLTGVVAMRGGGRGLTYEFVDARFGVGVAWDSQVGVVLPLTAEGANAKWRAVESVRRERSAAIQRAQAEHGDAEGRAWGRWTAEPVGLDEVAVRYEPSTGNPAFADQWGERGSWTYRVADLEVAV